MKIIRLIVIHTIALCSVVQGAEAPKPSIKLEFTVSEPAQEAGKSELLSCPTVITLAGQEATIAIGSEAPVEGPAQGGVRPTQLGVEIRCTPGINEDGSITVNGSINLRSLAKEQPQAAENIAWKAVQSLESTFSLKLAEGKPQTLDIPPCPDHPKGLQLTVTARILGQANAAVSYLKAFSLLPKLDPDESKLLKGRGAEIGAAHRELLKKAHASLAALTEADAASHCDWQLDLSQGLELSLPYLSSSRLLATIAMLQARIQWIDGNPAAAFAVWQQVKLEKLRKTLGARNEAALREIRRCTREGKAADPELLTAIPGMLLLPSMDSFLVKIRDRQRQRLLFLAALQLINHPAAANSDPWPLKNLPHRMQKTDGGFTLECDSVSGDKAKIIRLTVGE